MRTLKGKLLFWWTFTIVFAALFIGASCCYLYQDKRQMQSAWTEYLTESDVYTEQETNLMEDAIQVSVGTHICSIESVDIKNSQFTVAFNCWFNWQGRDGLDMQDSFEIYEGKINSSEKLKEYRADGENYQLFKVNATIHKEFDTRRFPLGSYQLRIYVIPLQTIERIVFLPDKDGSSVSAELGLTGFEATRHAVGLYIDRRDAAAFGAYHRSGTDTFSEILTEVELNRSSWGLYIKCTLALIGTAVWMLTVLFACSHHRVDTMGMISPVFIGTATNIMIGANLVPDALQAGLLEFINIWGIYTIIISTIVIMHINQMRQESGGDADVFGKTMFYTILATTAIGHIALPLAAYQF